MNKELIDEFESFCQSIGKPPMLCEFDFVLNKYRAKENLLSMDYSRALRMCYSLNFGLEVWLKEREKMEKLKRAFAKFISIAETCDGWEEFPSRHLEEAEKSLEAADD